MPTRTLDDMKYLEGVPVYGRCSKCARQFKTPLDELDQDHGKATREFYEAFERHECDSTEAGAGTLRPSGM